MNSRNEYLKAVKERYFRVKTKKGKSQILNEYCCNAGQARKHVITKIHKADLRPRQGKKRKVSYDIYWNRFWSLFRCNLMGILGY